MTVYRGLQHGDERLRVIRAGGREYDRRELYCELHGWIDRFLVESREGFYKKHGECRGRALPKKAA